MNCIEFKQTRDDDYPATILARYMVRGEQKVIMIRSMIKTTKNGRIRLLIAVMLSPDSVQDTIKQMPMGGVSIPRQ